MKFKKNKYVEIKKSWFYINENLCDTIKGFK